jgi:hypothetical protein
MPFLKIGNCGQNHQTATQWIYRARKKRKNIAIMIINHQIAALAAATWYASPVAAGHTMNGLETGLYGLAVLGVAIKFVGATVAKHWSLSTEP